MARNAIVLLRAAATGSGLKLTQTGNLSRGVVAEMVDAFMWPGFNRAYEFRLHKAVNEPDFLPVYFIRHVAETCKLLRKYKGHLRVTPAGRRRLDERNVGAAQAILLHTVFWHLNLSYLGGGLHGGWPIYDVGIVLWPLSVTANEWQTREHLTKSRRLCADSRRWRAKQAPPRSRRAQ